MSKLDPTSRLEQAESPTIPRNPFMFMWRISTPFWGYAIFALLFATVAQVTSLVAPYILKILVDSLTAASDNQGILESLEYWGSIYILANVVLFAGWRISGLIGVPWLAKSKEYSFLLLYHHVTKHSHGYFVDRFAGSVANKVSHASDGADNLIEQITWHYYPNILYLFGTAGLLLVTDIRIGLIFIGLALVIILVNVYLVRRRHPLIVAYAESTSTLKGQGVDLFTNIAAARQYVRFPHEMRRLRQYTADRTRKDIARDLSQEYGLLINNIIVLVAVIGMVLFLYQGVQAGNLTVGDVVLVLTLLWNASYGLIFIGNMLNSFIRVYGEIEEGLEAILVPYEVVDSPEAEMLKPQSADIKWQNVKFDFGPNQVFDNFNLEIKPGERIGLVGPSGAGKTTFVSLLLRQHDIQSGAILVDGQNIAEVTQDSLRRNIAVVPQEPLLFHRTIRENIAYGNPEASKSDIRGVAAKAQALDFILDLPEKFETLVGERGVKLSGGQKQRIAIARAMLKDAPILVLDEATSALDSESEVAIQKALHELMAEKTVVAIAHRLSTLREMDRIIVLENGQIMEDGTHEELAKAGGTYQRLWEHQAGGFLGD